MTQIWLASCGCWHEAWAGVFYPDDLPSSWRFSYYSNEFSEIYLRHHEWAIADAEILQSWMEDCDGRFQFLLQVDLSQFEEQTSSLDKALENLAILSGRVGLLAFGGSETELNKYLSTFVNQVPQAATFYDGESSEAGVSVPLLQTVPDAEAPIRANLLLVTFQPSNKTLAEWLKAIVASQQSGGIIFCADPPSVDSLRRAEGLLPYILPER